MAGRRGQNQAVKSGINESTMVYLSMAGVLVVLAGALYTFGIDLGFVHFGGTPNVNILYGGGVVCILLSYIIDIMYIKAIKRFYRAKDSYLDYVPYLNFIGVFGKVSIMASWVMVGIAAIIILPAMTFLGQYMPVDYLVFMAKKSVYVVLVIMAIFSFLRGYHCFIFKKQADSAYKKEISESYGSGGGLTLVGYVIYFLPIIRSISLFTDLNYINTVRRELEEMHRGEES